MNSEYDKNFKKKMKATAYFIGLFLEFAELIYLERFHCLQKLSNNPRPSLKKFQWSIKIDKLGKMKMIFRKFVREYQILSINCESS